MKTPAWNVVYSALGARSDDIHFGLPLWFLYSLEHVVALIMYLVTSWVSHWTPNCSRIWFDRTFNLYLFGRNTFGHTRNEFVAFHQEFGVNIPLALKMCHRIEWNLLFHWDTNVNPHAQHRTNRKYKCSKCYNSIDLWTRCKTFSKKKQMHKTRMSRRLLC